MNAEEFVGTLKQIVEQNAVKDVMKNLLQWSKKGVDHRLEYLSEWYKDLDVEGMECVTQIAKETATTTLFGLLCVLDGVRAIESGADKGRLELFFVKDDKRVLLNNFSDDYLHDIYKSLG